MENLKKGIIVLLILGAVGFILFIVIMVGAMSTPPSTLKIYYYDFSIGQEKEVDLKKVKSGIGTDEHTGDINLDTNFFNVVRYANYEDFSFPQQNFSDWKLIGYARNLTNDVSLFANSYGYSREKNLASPNRYHHYSSILEKIISEVKIVDDNNINVIQYTQRIAVKSNGEIIKSGLKQTDSFKSQLKLKYGEDIDFDGIYDEPDGGLCIINDKFEVIVDSSKILDRTLYVHKKQFNLKVLDIKGNIVDTQEVSIGSPMPNLSANLPDNFSLVGWRVQGTSQMIALENDYINDYKIFNQRFYKDLLLDDTLTICPVIERNNVEFQFVDSIVDCQYGSFLEFIPQAEDNHMVFCGWQYKNGQLFDGFVKDNMDIVPIWNGKSYKFNFNLNGGNCEDDLSQVYYKYGDEILILPNSITKEGYEFIGWFASPDDDNVQYSNSVGVLIGANNIFTDKHYPIINDTVTLYAHYRLLEEESD